MKALNYLLFFFLFISCTETTEAPSNPSEPDEPEDPVETETHDKFYFTFEEDILNFIFESKDTTYDLSDPVPLLRFNEDTVQVQKMKVRGNSASRVRRKSFNVDTEDFLSFRQEHISEPTESKDFRLLAMSADLCYIENRIGFGLLQQADIFPLFFKYVEVFLNEETNGVYFLIENPNDYFLDKNDHSILLRRGYYGNIDSYKYEDNGDGFSVGNYYAAFNTIYDVIKDYEGVELFDRLDEVLNVRQYMQKIAFDYLIQNGDYTDEIYLYDLPGDDKIRFHVVPWDLDDIFAELPHEIGITWGTGNVFGNRYYGSIQDVIDDVGEKLIFSIEDDLDYSIAKDPYLYSIYLEEMEKLMNLINESDIQREFDRIENELVDFFEDSAIVDQTSHDLEPCDAQSLIDEINDKEAFLINRRQFILDQL
ncbi:MAG: CotH kinase family protein [Bacteroidota bacterium]